MNIISKPELAKQVRREYEHLIKTESHEYAIAWVSTKLPFSEAMRVPALKRMIENRARIHIREREKFDMKKLQANDND